MDVEFLSYIDVSALDCDSDVKMDDDVGIERL